MHDVILRHQCQVNFARGGEILQQPAMDIKTAITLSGKKLGYGELKDKQVEAVASFMQGRDVFVSLPTGFGKSIIYALLPFAFDNMRGMDQY